MDAAELGVSAAAENGVEGAAGDDLRMLPIFSSAYTLVMYSWSFRMLMSSLAG